MVVMVSVRMTSFEESSWRMTLYFQPIALKDQRCIDQPAGAARQEDQCIKTRVSKEVWRANTRSNRAVAVGRKKGEK
ncbi:uncharacterized protein LOC128875692 isoform X2 [Hylaeus volcanicus]|uniref:uncharacterized protein LOC128875692 isoform X2 n=1 Tax=Hylaeus volcanicus TaxID=313075 RepID=UPI0023B84547|nr:uncharacterized protein LOC128875692 isoform X2 [Hylaeus volcanicus]